MNRSHIIEALRAADWSNTPNGNLALIQAAIEHLEAQPSSVMGRVPDAVVEPKSRYIHRNGVEYEVVMIANGESTSPKYPPTIVYRGVANGKVWARPACDWDRSMQLVERPAPAKVEDTEQVSSAWLAQLRSEYRQFAEVAEKRQAKLQSALARVAELEHVLQVVVNAADHGSWPTTVMHGIEKVREVLAGSGAPSKAQHSVPDDDMILQIFADNAEHSEQGDEHGYCIVREQHALAIARKLLAAAPASSEED
ncbi:TPA: hypothetical protein RG902_000742 [Pseudomonas aeruginosa]|nr:hypothetical protein [Pseudomonas aeruginosa]ELP1322155.1 hypothetical protein [Pseudomonas aeruginosa]HDU8971820.1 hypothetical protein [Pseudomonas aeruginosa]HEJ4106533.1 hypothetical protein [Pseudomonas aeruginosa]HEK0140348.1 hypothetical protein [Pseudomonas aeruginosa]